MPRDESAEIRWLPAESNPWGVPVLDVSPFTQSVLSSAQDPQNAVNLLSFGDDDGTRFIGKEPRLAHAVEARLDFATDGQLQDGVLFRPLQMEHKWAIFYHEGRIICVRSWTLGVELVAAVEQHGGYIMITAATGILQSDDEEDALTVRTLDYLLRSHALHVPYPVPLPPGVADDAMGAAIWCFARYGSLAMIATPYEFTRTSPDQPLRTE